MPNVPHPGPPRAHQANPAPPPEPTRIHGKALGKDRTSRYQTATDLKTDLLRLKRDVDSGSRSVSESSATRKSAAPVVEAIAVLYFEDLRGVKADE